MEGHTNPCLTCGACCATYRVSFYWAEADEQNPFAVPAEYVEKLNPFRVVMRGTNNGPHPRCAALLGDVGKDVHCFIYERRPSVCHELKISWSEGRAEEKCDKARAAWGLEPLRPEERFAEATSTNALIVDGPVVAEQSLGLPDAVIVSGLACPAD